MCDITLTIRKAYHLYFGCQTGDKDRAGHYTYFAMPLLCVIEAISRNR
jgi:hypothetical protein